MEGKCVLFKELGDVNAIPLVLNEQDPDKIIEIVAALEPSFGGINLEDISAPNCFYIEKELQKRMSIPVFHDDQHGTACVVLSALINALKLVGKKKKTYALPSPAPVPRDAPLPICSVSTVSATSFSATPKVS